MEGPGLTCSRCGERIGVYEPLWWEQPDGHAAPSSLLRAREHPAFGAPGSRFFHRDCYEDDAAGP